MVDVAPAKGVKLFALGVLYMRLLITLGLVSLSSLGIHDCKKTDEVTEAGGAPTATTPAAQGKIVNEKSITRYPTEQKTDQDFVLLQDATARVSPPNGSAVATVSAGTTVKKIATIPGGTLVVFSAPSGDRMMGWMDDASFLAPPEASTAPNRVLPVPVVSRDGGPTPTPPPSLDAGKSDPTPAQVVDAGAKPTAVVDAGAKPAAMVPVKKAVNGKCDPGWIIFPTGGPDCRKTCASDADCPGLKCAPKGSQKLCGT
jgi:hypothetical protein